MAIEFLLEKGVGDQPCFGVQKYRKRAQEPGATGREESLAQGMVDVRRWQLVSAPRVPFPDKPLGEVKVMAGVGNTNGHITLL
jgi:hypothetical protein